MTTTTMDQSWLVQRLTKPRSFGKLDNPSAFGGGLRNGGLSSEAMDLLRGVFAFDYMGAAEFEYGAVPKALQGLARDADTLAATTISIPLADVAPSFKDKSTATGEATVYLLCRQDQQAEVESRIRHWAKQGYKANLKEATRLDSTLRPYSEWDGEVVGWLELDNGFMFFTDRDMWSKTCELFGVAVTA